MKVPTFVFLVCALLAAATTLAAAARTSKPRVICNVHLGTCKTSLISRTPIAGMQCRMLNANWSRRRGGYICT